MAVWKRIFTAPIQSRLLSLTAALPFAMLIISIFMVSAVIGVLSEITGTFPADVIDHAILTGVVLYDQLYPPSISPSGLVGWEAGNASDIRDRRIVARAAVPTAARNEHFLMNGGLYQYMNYCPGYGCIAAEFDRAGNLIHAYPYRPDQFHEHQIVSLPYEEVLFQFSKNMIPAGVLKLPDDDLIVTFLQMNSFPYGGGIARVHPDGSVEWFRRDYSEHWPRLLPSGNIAVPALRIGGSRLSVPLAEGTRTVLNCRSKILEDIIRILNPDGQVQQEISVFDALVHSPYRGLLKGAPPCDPLHVNYVAPVTRAMESLLPDVSPGDLVVSLRNLDAFVILGRRDHRLKHLFRGTFIHQHSVQPLGQSANVLIFDNLGGDRNSGPSRLLEYDLANHTERNLLLKAGFGGSAGFSDEFGNISVSPDYSRAIVAYTETGRAYEIRLADGKVLTTFDNLQDVHKVRAVAGAHADELARFFLYTVTYTQ